MAYPVSSRRRTAVTGTDEHDFGYTDICAKLADRFGTNFRVEVTGNCMTLVADFEGGIQLIVTDCVGYVVAVPWHRDYPLGGRLHRFAPGAGDAEGCAQVDIQLATPAANRLC